MSNKKYSHVGILKNRSLLTIHPFSPLKKEINNKIKEAEIDFNKDLNDLIKNENQKKELEALLKTNGKDFIKNLNKIKLSYEEDKYSSEKKLIEQIEKITLLNKASNFLILAEKNYDSAMLLPDKDLRLNLFYYFLLNIVKTHNIYRYFYNEDVKYKFDLFFEVWEESIKNKETNKDESKKEYRVFKYKYFTTDCSHGLIFKEYGEKTSLPICRIAANPNNDIENINYLKTNLFFSYYLSTYDKGNVSMPNIHKDFKDHYINKPITLDDLITQIVEFKNIANEFSKSSEKAYNSTSLGSSPITLIYDKSLKLETFKFDISNVFLNDDQENLNELEKDKILNKILEKMFKSKRIKYETKKVNKYADKYNCELLIDKKTYYDYLINHRKAEYNKETDSLTNVDILQELYNLFNENNNEIYLINEYILTSNGYNYYTKKTTHPNKINGCKDGENNRIKYYPLNINRYLFLFILSNEVRYYPNLLLKNSEEHDRYEYLIEEAGTILPKQFLYEITSRILGKACVIPFSSI